MSDDSELSGLDSDADSVDDIISKFQRQGSDDEDNEGVFDIASDVDDDDDDDEDEGEYEKPYFPDQYEIMAKKEEMASDLEDSDEEEEDESGLPDAKNWGSKKADYYSTDYVDTGRRHKIDAADEGNAAAEEAEAIAIQKRLMSEMKDADLGFDLLDDESAVTSSASAGTRTIANEDDNDDEEAVERVKMNTTGLSDREKEQLVRRLHPELIPILEDFKSYLKEASEVLEPIVDAAGTEAGRSLHSWSGFHVINLKYKLIKGYAETIAHYFLLKCRSVDVKKHPLSARLFNLKKLIRELEQVMDKHSLKKSAKQLAAMISTQSSDRITFTPVPYMSEAEEQLLREIDIDHQLGLLQAAGADSSAAGVSGSNKLRSAGPGAESEDRRAVTNEMEKNRGMTAVRKKTIKNPRVKHRLKYAKAVVRRKGQVRAPRKELSRYAGETSGIKGSLVRSIKFKN